MPSGVTSAAEAHTFMQKLVSLACRNILYLVRRARSKWTNTADTEEPEKKRIVPFVLYFKGFRILLLGGTFGTFFN